MEDKGEDETSLSLTYNHVNQLKHAWQCEHDDLVAEREVSGKLRESLEYMKVELESANSKTDIERARADLGILSTCNPGRPDILVDSIVEILPRPSIPGLEDTEKFVRLSCCIRSERWVVIGSDHQADEYHECSSSQTKNLDDMAHDLARAQYHRLSEVGLSSGSAKELLSFLSNGRDLEGSAQEILNNTFVLPVFPRCLWFVQTPPLYSKAHSVTVTNLESLMEAESEAELAENDAIKLRDICENLVPVSDLLSGSWFGILETASQLTMASYIQKMTANEAAAVDVASAVAATTCAHLYSAQAFVNGDINMAEETLRSLPGALSRALKAKSRDLEVGLFAVMTTHSDHGVSAAGAGRGTSAAVKDVSVVSCQRFDAWRLMVGADTQACLAASCVLDNESALYYADAPSASCMPDIDFDGAHLDDGDDDGVRAALAIPLIAPTVFSSNAHAPVDAADRAAAATIDPSGGERAEDRLRMGFSVVLRSHSSTAFSSMERRVLVKALTGVAGMLKGYVLAHRQIFNPLSTRASTSNQISGLGPGDAPNGLSALSLPAPGPAPLDYSSNSAAGSGSGSGADTSTSTSTGRAEDVSITTKLLSCLRSVLDENTVDREEVLLNTIRAFALAMPAQWFLCFEIEGRPDDGSDDGDKGEGINIMVPPYLRALAAQNGGALPPKQALSPATALRGGLLDFFLWLAQAPALTPSSGEPASHLLSAARVENGLDVMGDGLLHLLDWDYYAEFREADKGHMERRSRRAGTTDALSVRHKLAHHLARGSTPVFGARIDCYRHMDVEQASPDEVTGGRERYTRSLLILTGAVHSSLQLPAMIKRTRELTNFLDLLATVGDIQTILSNYSAFHGQVNAITNRVTAEDVINAATRALCNTLADLSVACSALQEGGEGEEEEEGKSGGAYDAASIRMQFCASIRTFLSRIHSALPPSPSPGEREGEVAAGAESDRFDASSVSIQLQETLAEQQPRTWEVDEGGGLSLVEGLQGQAFTRESESGAVWGRHSGERRRQLYTADLGAGSDDVGAVGVAVSVWLRWEEGRPTGQGEGEERLASLEKVLLEQCRSFLRCNLTSFLMHTSSSPSNRIHSVHPSSPGPARVREELMSMSMRMAVETPDGGSAAVALGNVDLCKSVTTSHPGFCCVPIAVPFEAVKAVDHDAHRDQTKVAYRLSTRLETARERNNRTHRATTHSHPTSSSGATGSFSPQQPRTAAAPAAGAVLERTVVHDLRRADELGLGEPLPVLPSAAAAIVGAVADTLLPYLHRASAQPSSSNGGADVVSGTISNPWLDGDSAASVRASTRVLHSHLSPDGTLTVAVVFTSVASDAGLEMLDYLCFPPNNATDGGGGADGESNVLTAQDYESASRGLGPGSRPVLVLMLPGQAASSASLRAAQNTLYNSPDGKVHRGPHYSICGYFVLPRSQHAFLAPSAFRAVSEDLACMLRMHASALRAQTQTQIEAPYENADGSLLDASGWSFKQAMIEGGAHDDDVKVGRSSSLEEDDGDSQGNHSTPGLAVRMPASRVNSATISRDTACALLSSWHNHSLSMVEEQYNRTHNENARCSRTAVYSLLGREGTHASLEQCVDVDTTEQPPMYLVDSGGVLVGDEPFLLAEKALASIARVPVSKSAGYCSSDHTPTSDNIDNGGIDAAYAADQRVDQASGQVTVMVESCVAPHSHTSLALKGRQRPVTHYVRISITIPAAYLGINTVEHEHKHALGEAEGRSTRPDSQEDSHTPRPRVVLASLILWFDGFSLRVPAQLMRNLLRAGAEVAQLLPRQAMTYLSYRRVVSALHRCVLNSVSRAVEARVCVGKTRAQILKLLEVVNSLTRARARTGTPSSGDPMDPPSDPVTKEIALACQVLGLDDLFESLRRETLAMDAASASESDSSLSWEGVALEAIVPAVLADIATATTEALLDAGNDTASKALVSTKRVVGPGQDYETSSLRNTAHAVVTVTTALATTLANLADEKHNVGRMRHQIASTSVRLREEKAHSAAFVSAMEGLMIGAGGSLRQHTRTQGSTLVQQHKKQSSACLVHDKNSYDRLRTLVETTSDLTAKLLAFCGLQTRREEASRLALGAASDSLLRGVHHQALLEDLPKGTYDAVARLLQHEMCVWTDGRGPPDVLPAIKDLLRPDLLLAAWQSGLRTRGPLQRHHHIAFGLMDDQGDISDGSGMTAQLVVEYVPVLGAYHANTHDHRSHGSHGSHGQSYGNEKHEHEHVRLHASFPVAVVQHVTLLGREDRGLPRARGAAGAGERALLSDDEAVRSDDDDGDDDESLGVSAAAATDDVRKWLQHALSHMRRPRLADGTIALTHDHRESEAMHQLLAEAGRACDDILALRALVDANIEHNKDEGMRDLMNIHQSEDWRDFCAAAAQYAATKMRGTVTFLYPHLASAGFTGERDDESDSDDSSVSQASSESSSDSDDDGASTTSDGSHGNGSANTSSSSVSSDSDDTYARKQRMHDRETWLQLAGSRASFRNILTLEDVEEHESLVRAEKIAGSPEKAFDAAASRPPATATATATAESVKGSVVIISRTKLSELCASAEENGHVTTFPEDSLDIYGPLDVKHLLHAEEAEHHVLVLSFSVDPIDKHHRHNGTHSATAVHRRYLNGIKRLRWMMVLQCDRVVSSEDLTTARAVAATMRTLITHRTLITIQATLNKHMSELDTMMAVRSHHSQQMADIWKFTDALHAAIRVVSHDTSAAIRRLCAMIEEDLPPLVGATFARLIASDDDKEERGDREHHETRRQHQQHRHDRHHHQHKGPDFARMCVETNSIVVQRTYRRHADSEGGMRIVGDTAVIDKEDADADKRRRRRRKKKEKDNSGRTEQSQPDEHVYYWVPVMKAKLSHIGIDSVASHSNHHAEEEDQQDHVYWAMCVQAEEASPLGRALHLYATSAIGNDVSNAAAITGNTSASAAAGQHHIGADLEYAEASGNTHYENLCFILKEIRSNVTVIALQRSAANVDRHNHWLQKMATVVHRAVAAVGGLEAKGLSIPVIAKTLSSEMFHADVETKMQTAHHGHHHHHHHHHGHHHHHDGEGTGETDEGKDGERRHSKRGGGRKENATIDPSDVEAARGGAAYGGGQGKSLDADSFHSDVCSVRGRLHWLAEVPVDSRTDSSGVRPGYATMMQQAAGVGMGVHFNMAPHKKRWLSTVDDQTLDELVQMGLTDGIVPDAAWAAEGRETGTTGGGDDRGAHSHHHGHRSSGSSERARPNKGATRRGSGGPRDRVYTSEEGVAEEKEMDREQRSIEHLEHQLSGLISAEHGVVGSPDAEASYDYVTRSAMDADTVQSALGKGLDDSYLAVTTVPSSPDCVPNILRYQHHAHLREEHRHSQAHVRTDYGAEIGAHIDEAENDDHKYEHDHLVTSVFIDVSAGHNKAILELKLSYCPHSLFPLNHAGMHESGSHITSFVRKCIRHLAETGPLMALSYAVQRGIRTVDISRTMIGYSVALSDALSETRNNIRVVVGCLRELCIDKAAGEVYPTSAEEDKRDGRASSDASAIANKESKISATALSSEDVNEAGEIDPHGSINQKIRRVHTVFHSIVDRVQTQLLHLDGVMGIVVTAWDTERGLELYKKCAEINSEGVPCVSEGAVGAFNNEKSEKYQYLGTTSEYSYECGEISGVVSFYLKKSDENLAKKFGLASAVGHEAVDAIEAERQYHEEETSRLIKHLVEALARRLFELVRGGRLQQIMVVQQRSLIEARQATVQLKRSSELSSAKAAQLEAEYQGLSKEKDGLEHQLRIEKQVNMEAIDANRKLSEKSAHITAAVREEHERELALMKTVYEKERELLELDVGQREAVIKLLKEGRSVAEVEQYERGNEQDFGESELGRTRY